MKKEINGIEKTVNENVENIELLKNKNQEPCDKCERQGYVCKIVKRGGGGWQMKKI